ncbi:MAG TPA: hypothetical protein VJK29_10635 [Terriglobales bacterium]|nr:MAG: hypothetical protein AUG13_01635 [Chloroflexi bacterium 13_1_20CM_2_59_7]HLB88097.1 hypothetical protein [Terriglobales bacterium]
MNDVPKLLVEWSSPWEEFITAIRPALRRSPKRLAGEARSGLFPYRGMLFSWVVEAALLILVIVLPAQLTSMSPYTPPPSPKYDIIYFSGDELPQTEDAAGAEAGRSGRSGGQEAHHPTQIIRVARGSSLRETVVDAPKLNLPRSDSAVANLLAYKPVPGPPPAEGLKSSLRVPAVPETAVPPPPEVERDKSRTTPVLNAGVIAPAPEVQRDRMQAAPALNSGVIPPSPAGPQREMASLSVPGSHAVEVIPPPVSAPEQVTNSNPRLTLPAPSVIAPPPTQVTREMASMGPGFGTGELRKQVVPPPVQLGTGSLHQEQPVGGLGGGGGAVVPPPPTISGGNSLTGRGSGNRGSGLGGPQDTGAVAAPPAGGGSGGGTGVVVSSRPGSKVGVPGSGGTGALAMSPSGGASPGLGGSGGGAGIGRGNGPGSGFSGEGPGAGKQGSGRGSDATAHGGISPYPGPGGAGTGTNGTPAMPGVSVKGGSNIVTLPSFGANGRQSADPSHSSATGHGGPDITVVASSRSGGAFNFYGALKGDKVYTIYIETGLGTAVMQYADPTSAQHPYAEDLLAPQPMHTDLPAGLPHARLVITCILTPSGLLRNPLVLEPGPAVMTSKVLAALSNWKFRPALRGSQPVEVNAILGFNIDTSDRF